MEEREQESPEQRDGLAQGPAGLGLRLGGGGDPEVQREGVTQAGRHLKVLSWGNNCYCPRNRAELAKLYK